MGRVDSAQGIHSLLFEGAGCGSAAVDGGRVAGKGTYNLAGACRCWHEIHHAAMQRTMG